MIGTHSVTDVFKAEVPILPAILGHFALPLNGVNGMSLEKQKAPLHGHFIYVNVGKKNMQVEKYLAGETKKRNDCNGR